MAKLERYQEGQDWESWCEQLEFYFLTKDTQADKKKSTLLSSIPSETYQLAKDLVAPQKLKDNAVTYEIIVDKVQKHVKPEKTPLVARKELDDRTRRPDEPVKDYVAAIQRLSQECKFSSEPIRKERLRDRLLSGVKDDDMVKAMLKVTFEDLTLDEAIKQCVAEEKSKQDTKALVPEATASASSVSSSVHMVKKQKAVASGGTARASKSLAVKPDRGANSWKPQSSRLDRGASSGSVQSGTVQSGTVRTVKPDNASPPLEKCFRCNGRDHGHWECRFRRERCYKCGKIGHTQITCSPPEVNLLNEPESDDELDMPGTLYKVDSVPQLSQAAMTVKLAVEGKMLEMIVDTAASVSVMGLAKWKAMFPDKQLSPSTLTLATYTGEDICPVGSAEVKVVANGTELTLPMHVVAGEAPTLMGRNWLSSIQPSWRNALKVDSQPVYKLDSMLDQFDELFAPGLGKLVTVQAKLELKDDVKPKFFKSRPVPLALQEKVAAELNKLENMGVIEPVKTSEWAAPMVTVLKRDGRIRLCGDFKVTVNPQLQIDQHPLPRIEEIYAKLSGGQQFSKLDLRDAYFQMEVDESSRKYLTVNTCKGLYQYCRLPFGIASAPALWQRAMDQNFAGLPVQCYLDDLVVTGKTREEHLRNLSCVLSRLKELGLKLNRDKCEFLKDRIEYCGHVITKEGLQQAPAKVAAMVNMPAPSDVKQLRAFIGMVQYYARFVPNLSHQLRPLLELLVKGKKWTWGRRQQDAFKAVKQELLSNRVLTHYSQDLPLSLACDSSAYGIGSVLSHKMPDGSERPIAYASRTLTTAERNYAQIEREALSLVWGTRKFSQYLLGRHFTLITDHQPLKFLFDEKRGVSATAAARIQRWCLYLGQFDYTINFRGTQKHANCDGLSRLPQSGGQEHDVPEVTSEDLGEVFVLDQLEQIPVTVCEIANESASDVVVSQVMRAVLRGSSSDLPATEEFRPYLTRFNDLSVMKDCLMWGLRVVIPAKFQDYVLSELHQGHEGIVKMKSRARSVTWWPTLDKDIETLSKSCETCVSNSPSPPTEYGTWPETSRPFERVHVDFGDYKGQMFLIVVDAYSKWPEVLLMNSTTAEKTVLELRTVFARWGLPEVLVSDNGPQFTSSVFRDFMRNNGIRHVTSAAYHPATNGLAEKAVGIVKQALKKMKSMEIRRRLDCFLHSYRNTPTTSTGRAPAELMMGRLLRSRLDLLCPGQPPKLTLNPGKRALVVGQQVKVRAYLGPKRWVAGFIEEALGPKTYLIKLIESPYKGFVWRRHVNQIVPSNVAPVDESVTRINVNSGAGGAPSCISQDVPAPMDAAVAMPPAAVVSEESVPGLPTPNSLGMQSSPTQPVTTAPAVTEPRQSTRIKSTPVKFKDYVLSK